MIKLSARYNKATLVITIVVLLITGAVYYALINYIVNKQLDRDLIEELTEIRDFVKQNKHLPQQLDFEGDQTAFTPTTRQESSITFYDTPYYKRNNKTEAGRAVKAFITLHGKNYVATVTISKEGSENIAQLIIGVTILLTAVLIIILALTNRYIFSGIWQPFYDILQELKAFNIADSENIKTNSSNIEEFRELNDAVATMSTRVKTDYQNLKTFAENASHEMLTPIAVINSKLDTLIQDEQLRDEQFAQISHIYAATNKLSRLNQSLLLLVKIDNHLINEVSTFNLKNVIVQKERQLQELVQSKGITLIDLLDDKEITASQYLIEILINNLFNNAIKHNVTKGQLYIRLSKRELVFENSGSAALNDAEIFERFKRGSNSDGTGLGLTIAKNICAQYGYQLTYRFENQMHRFSVIF
ncbi:sensor histidine kinase [Mucilaginibacter ximonensis]|uniref:histidine kinase n=1 Tax=Mucilaginibacter ximonensis TaxID=538021 RepID=A0ABW5YFA1_9SPHI